MTSSLPTSLSLSIFQVCWFGGLRSFVFGFWMSISTHGLNILGMTLARLTNLAGCRALRPVVFKLFDRSFFRFLHNTGALCTLSNGMLRLRELQHRSPMFSAEYTTSKPGIIENAIYRFQG